MKTTVLLILLVCSVVFAQPPNPAPDCSIPFNFTATPQFAPGINALDNRATGCSFWSFNVSSRGFTAVTVTAQSAPDTTTGPGSFVTFLNQTVPIGANPFIGVGAGAASGPTYIQGYNPWVRVAFTAATGSGNVVGALYGWKLPFPAGTTTVSPNVNIQQYGGTGTSLGQKTAAASIPVVLASNQTPFGNCPVPVSAVFNLSGSGNTRIVTGVGGQSIHVCNLSFSTTNTEDVKLVIGTGATCGASTADLTGLYKSILSFSNDWHGDLAGTAGLDLCINQSVAQALGGVITYEIY